MDVPLEIESRHGKFNITGVCPPSDWLRPKKFKLRYIPKLGMVLSVDMIHEIYNVIYIYIYIYSTQQCDHNNIDVGSFWVVYRQ